MPFGAEQSEGLASKNLLRAKRELTNSFWNRIKLEEQVSKLHFLAEICNTGTCT